MFWTAMAMAALSQLVLHWFPWRMVFKKDLPRLVAYVLGVLGFMCPLSYLLVQGGEIQALVTAWAMIVVSGAAVVLAWGVDWLLNYIRSLDEQKELRNGKQ